MDSINLSITLTELPSQEYLDELLRKLLVTAGDRRLNLNVYVHP